MIKKVTYVTICLRGGLKIWRELTHNIGGSLTDKITIKDEKINDNIAYIKLKIEKYNNEEETVCLSFHKDIKI